MKNFEQEAALHALGGVSKDGETYEFAPPIPIGDSWNLRVITLSSGLALGKIRFVNDAHVLDINTSSEEPAITISQRDLSHTGMVRSLVITNHSIKGWLGVNGPKPVYGPLKQTARGLSLMEPENISSEPDDIISSGSDEILFSHLESFRKALSSLDAGVQNTFLATLPGAKHLLKAVKYAVNLPLDKDSFFSGRRKGEDAKTAKQFAAVPPILVTATSLDLVGVKPSIFQASPFGQVAVRDYIERTLFNYSSPSGDRCELHVSDRGKPSYARLTFLGEPPTTVVFDQNSRGKFSVSMTPSTDGKSKVNYERLKNLLTDCGRAILRITNDISADYERWDNEKAMLRSQIREAALNLTTLSYEMISTSRPTMVGVIKRLSKAPAAATEKSEVKLAQ